ncbi:MAG TPA: CGNR zinc finger domain-containing protein [Solirubrobacteraceae bacterium]|nr:CGNR zinc finger domain-containing protein [Solirubrobacteraceae bacterium]
MADEKQPPPDGLSLVIDYVNTRDREAGSDDIGTPSELGRWLHEHGLLDGRTASELGEGELQRAVELREELREHMFANNADQPADWGALDRIVRRGRLQVRFTDDGEALLEPAAAGFDGALAGLLVPVAVAARAGSWRRVKACAADTCQWAFYDRSRNRSGRWCEMAVCGNRTKVRSYRARSSAGGEPQDAGAGS